MNREEIIETITCNLGLEDEILKLFCLVKCCASNIQKDGEDFLSRQYLVSKIQRVLEGIPIILDQSGKEMFIRLKLQQNKEK